MMSEKVAETPLFCCTLPCFAAGDGSASVSQYSLIDYVRSLKPVMFVLMFVFVKADYFAVSHKIFMRFLCNFTISILSILSLIEHITARFSLDSFTACLYN